MAIARDSADWVRKESDVQDLRKGDEVRDILPFPNLVVVQVEKLEVCHSFKDLRAWEVHYVIMRDIELLQVLESLQVHQILQVEPVALQVPDVEV